jgi:hypothetical protein
MIMRPPRSSSPPFRLAPMAVSSSRRGLLCGARESVHLKPPSSELPNGFGRVDPSRRRCDTRLRAVCWEFNGVGPTNGFGIRDRSHAAPTHGCVLHRQRPPRRCAGRTTLPGRRVCWGTFRNRAGDTVRRRLDSAQAEQPRGLDVREKCDPHHLTSGFYVTILQPAPAPEDEMTPHPRPFLAP